MKTLRIEKRLGRPAIALAGTIALAGAIALIVAGCASGEAAGRKKVLTAASSAQQEKPVKLRYYGGPKYPRYPE
jgi:hypothetical protein